ncbi:uncharacterized protein LOC108680704 [Hyalella azteca]|uniref:Uncharacterized protein LOC108680704 n=1 Tax=Hyalella azteca TaxID=294128 RepID=A0A8B7PG11_HYAAZ|nr:uncharacterized protein LOC108680704 [Hyalella azteca]
MRKNCLRSDLEKLITSVGMDTMDYRSRRTKSSSQAATTRVVLLTVLALQLPGSLCHSRPLIDPDVMTQGTHPQLTLLYHPKFTTLITLAGIPAPQGTDFEGPDPGLNAAIISAPDVCPNQYMRDAGGRCRPAFTYGPNPLSTFSPEKYKGSIQFYMGLQVGRPTQLNRRRNPQRQRNGAAAGSRRQGRLNFPLRSPAPETAATTTTVAPLDHLLDQELLQEIPEVPLPSTENESSSALPTPPPLTNTVAEITAILAKLNDEKSSSDSQTIDDDDD